MTRKEASQLAREIGKLLAQIKARRRQYELVIRFDTARSRRLAKAAFSQAGSGDIDKGALRLATNWTFLTKANKAMLRQEPFWLYPESFHPMLERKAKQRKRRRKQYVRNYQRELAAKIAWRKEQRAKKAQEKANETPNQVGPGDRAAYPPGRDRGGHHGPGD